MTFGKLWGIGLGPGDPELVTVKAARIIGAADVIAFHSARHGRSISRATAVPYMREGQIEEHLIYPVTTETTDHPGGYAGAIDDFYAEAAERLAGHLQAGRTVALLAAGDPSSTARSCTCTSGSRRSSRLRSSPVSPPFRRRLQH